MDDRTVILLGNSYILHLSNHEGTNKKAHRQMLICICWGAGWRYSTLNMLLHGVSDGLFSKHWVHQESQARSLVAVAGKDTVRYIL